MTHPAIEQPYRTVWARSTPDQRRAWQAGDGQGYRVLTPHFAEDVDGLPLSAGYTVENGGLLSVPPFVYSWNPDHDEPTTTEEDYAE